VSAAPAKRVDAPLTPAQLRNRRLRNIAIGLAVAGLAVLFYAITIVKMAPGLFLKGSP
jgi:hypothetical protein